MNESFDKSFTVTLINQVEDLDGDGIEDAYDEDIDGDGYSNEQEISEGTDPKNQYSHSNKPILRTLNGVLNDDGSIDLNGSVLSDGQGQVSDFGFIISRGYLWIVKNPQFTGYGQWVNQRHLISKLMKVRSNMHCILGRGQRM